MTSLIGLGLARSEARDRRTRLAHLGHSRFSRVIGDVIDKDWFIRRMSIVLWRLQSAVQHSGCSLGAAGLQSEQYLL